MAQLRDDCFASGTSLMTTAEALALIANRVGPVTDTEPLGLRGAVSRILAQDVIADHDVPLHDNSAVDGYAFAFGELDHGAQTTTFAVSGRAAAGHPLDAKTEPRTAIRIFTGAVMPTGCDTVAMQEDCDQTTSQAATIPNGLIRGANRRKAGEDTSAGTTILKRGHRLRPQDIGLAATVGRAELLCYRRLRAAIFSTGDEVHEPGTGVERGGIYDANRYVLLALLDGLGCDVSDLGILPDNRSEISNALDRAATTADVIVSSGGVSVGEEDHIKAVVEELGHLHFWRLAIKPGRPLALGQIGQIPFIGLPGNPVAAMVTFVRFARPLILRLGGANNVAPNLFRVRADFTHTKKRNRREWIRARLVAGTDGALSAQKFDRQGAGILTSLVDSDGLVELPEDLTHLVAGSMVDFLPFSEVTP
jgi:molybdopterin molybdotransferase